MKIIIAILNVHPLFPATSEPVACAECVFQEMELQQFSRKHDAVLELLKGLVRSHLPGTFNTSVDLASEQYSFQQYTVPTDMRPDLAKLSDSAEILGMLELTISFERSA